MLQLVYFVRQRLRYAHSKSKLFVPENVGTVLSRYVTNFLSQHQVSCLVAALVETDG